MNNITKPQIQNFVDLHQIAYSTKHDLNLSKNIHKPKITYCTEYDRKYMKFSQKYPTKKQYQEKSVRLQSLGPTETQYGNKYQTSISERTQILKQSSEVDTQSPFACTTTYNTSYIGHKGSNQYVKMKPPEVLQKLKFDGKSTYQTTFTRSKNRRNSSYVGDSLQKSFRSVSNVEQKIREQTYRSTYTSDFSKKVKTQNNEQKALDYSSMLLFTAPTKRREEKKSSYDIQFQQNPQKIQIHSKKAQFKMYHKKQLQQLKKRILTCIS